MLFLIHAFSPPVNCYLFPGGGLGGEEREKAQENLLPLEVNGGKGYQMRIIVGAREGTGRIATGHELCESEYSGGASTSFAGFKSTHK